MIDIPEVLFHGTNELFEFFDSASVGKQTDSGIYGEGFYFSACKSEAAKYGPHVLEVRLSLSNPFVVQRGESVQAALRRMGQLSASTHTLNPIGESTCTSTEATAIIKGMGHDGVAKIDYYHNEYVAFDPGQVEVLQPLPRNRTLNKARIS